VKDLSELGSHRESALDRVRWRCLICIKRPIKPRKHGQRTLNGDDNDDELSEAFLRFGGTIYYNVASKYTS